MDSSSHPDQTQPGASASLSRGLGRRQFLNLAVKATGGLLAADLASARAGRAQAPAATTRRFTDWGWPLPYEQISSKSKQWLQGKGWWPINAGWIVVWSSEEMIGTILQTEKLMFQTGSDPRGKSPWRPLDLARTNRSFHSLDPALVLRESRSVVNTRLGKRDG